MLDEKAIPYRYREYTREPLTEGEIREILRLLDISARDLLRTKDPAYAELGLAGEERNDELIRAMARHPTLIQRPIGRLPGKAVLGRPPERLLELAADQVPAAPGLGCGASRGVQKIAQTAESSDTHPALRES